MTPTLKRKAACALRRTCGRRSLIRYGRFLLNAGRFDENNVMEANGEYRLLREIVAVAQNLNNGLSIVDIGANLGSYSLEAARVAFDSGLSNVKILAMEACHDTHAMLVENIERSGYAQWITAIDCAVSNTCGVARFNVINAGAGRNSLLPVEDSEGVAVEDVVVTTIDRFLDEQDLETVNAVKIDTEGHDFAVLSGARHALEQRRIGVVQFEYNWRWIEQRAYLRDVFRFIEDMDYSLGKVTPDGIEFFDRWYPQLETLIESNYAIVRGELCDHFSRIEPMSQI